MAIFLKDWKPRSQRPATFEEMNHDDIAPSGLPGIDNLLLGESGDHYYGGLGEIAENDSILSAGIRHG